ncbi:MAG: AAA family ATPase [Burkholderiales bacterium]|nr:AAA family ATPase [Burkholderiales bacterium]
MFVGAAFAEQRTIVTALLDPGRYPHTTKSVKLLETHISWVLLAGRYAYKIKKAVHPGFLDFTSIESRRFYCGEEIRLNKRLAPMLYLDVVPIGGIPENPVLGGAPAIEYAVRMRRFASKNRLDLLAGRGEILPDHLDALAVKIARFHDTLPPSSATSGFGADILDVVRITFNELRIHLDDDISVLEEKLENEYASCAEIFETRLKEGFVRECHGDLHLGNIALVKGIPVPFDCLEFDPKLRWIDVMNEMAFPVMDLMHHGRPDFAFRLLNAYLEQTGDYMGMRVFRFYLSCRAIVRAMVDAMRTEHRSCRSHLALASDILSTRKPFLIITHGLPGCGKTTFSQSALERFQAIRIRSDVERKRLAKLIPQARSHSDIDAGMYSSEASTRAYSRLLALARELLAAGFPVIVDAAFLEHEKRDQFRALARDMTIPFAIASLQADYPTLKQRILERSKLAIDASEADLAVLDAKIASYAPLLPEESHFSAQFCDATDPAGWKKLGELLAPKPAMESSMRAT